MLDHRKNPQILSTIRCVRERCDRTHVNGIQGGGQEFIYTTKKL